MNESTKPISSYFKIRLMWLTLAIVVENISYNFYAIFLLVVLASIGKHFVGLLIAIFKVTFHKSIIDPLTISLIKLMFYVCSFAGLHYAGPFHLLFLRYKLAPTITAIENYRRDEGTYPEKLEQLLPKYLTTLPSCFPPGYMPISYDSYSQDKFSVKNDFGLTCLTLGFLKATYHPDRGWYLWD